MLLLLGLLSGTVGPEPMTVAQLEARGAQLAGRTVRVVGLLAECQPLSCGLIGDGTTAGNFEWLSFETAPAFDAIAQPSIRHRVVVEGIILAQGWPAPSRRSRGVVPPRPPCIDRCSRFRPLRIVRDLGASEGS